MDTLTYEIDGNLYVNLTNKCTNRCVFCVRNKDTYEGYPLWLEKEPDAEAVIQSIPKELSEYKEVVFCGYGEPTFRIDTLVELGKYFKSKGKTTRLNTNGHGNAINKKNIAPMLVGAIDIVSISLNQSDREKYEKICKCCYKEEGFDILLDFARSCVAENLYTQLSIVAVDGVDVNACQQVADSVNAKLKVREYIDIEN